MGILAFGLFAFFHQTYLNAQWSAVNSHVVARFPSHAAATIAIVLPLVVAVAGLIVFLVVSDSRSRRPSGVDEYPRDDDRYGVLGVLDNNSNDPRVSVPKRYSGGLALNVGTPSGQLVMAGILVLVIGLALLKALSSDSGC